MKQIYNPYYCLRIISLDPLITMSGCQTDDIFMKKMADDLPEVFGRKFGLHFLLPTWNLEQKRAAQIKDSIAAAAKKLPGHAFVVVSSTEFETLLLSKEGVPTLSVHQAIFVDDKKWQPTSEKYPQLGQFDAVINARFDAAKRHELASKIKKILLTYGYSLDGDVDQTTNRIKKLLPHAYYANHALHDGTYSYMSRPEIVKLFGHVQVGLCLSPEEGYSRASIEYLLCGLPVVSTKSIGGRDRYYANKYCRIVEPDGQEVAKAVEELKTQNFSRDGVRSHILQLIEFDRQNFLRNFTKTVQDYTGTKQTFDTITPFLDVKQEFITHSKILEQLRFQLSKSK